MIEAAVLLGGHPDRPVRREGDAVVKTYHAADGGRIFAEHRMLWDSTLGPRRRPPGVPEPYSWDAQRRELSMEVVPGEPLGGRGDLGRSLARAREAATLLADLHGCGVRPARRRGASAVLRSLARKADDLGGGPASREFARAVARAARMADERDVAGAERLVPTHGDWSPRNVMAGPTGLRMIDFDRLQLAGAGRDLAYWGAWAWATLALRGDEPSWTPAESYEAAYLRARPGARAEVSTTLHFNRTAALLRIAHGWSALRGRPGLMRAVIAEASACAGG